MAKAIVAINHGGGRSRTVAGDSGARVDATATKYPAIMRYQPRTMTVDAEAGCMHQRVCRGCGSLFFDTFRGKRGPNTGFAS